MFIFLKKIRNYFGKLLGKKQYLEFITALLSIPVLITVLFLNYSNIKERNKNTDSAAKQPVITIIQQNKPDEITPLPTEIAECLPEIGKINLESPKQDETISANPLPIYIKRLPNGKKYCSIVWSYRINNGDWSDFSDKDMSIYNLESGEKTLELKVKSIVSGEEQNIVREFTYKNTQEVPTPTSTVTSTPTPSPTNLITQPVE